MADRLTKNAADPQWLEIGKILGPQGLHGELRVYPDTDFPERFLQPGPRWLLGPNMHQPQTVELVRGRYLGNKGLYVVQIQGIHDRQQAEMLRNGRLMVPASDRPTLQPGEFHVLDLIGLNVFDQSTQHPIGTVIDVLAAGNDLLEIGLNPDVLGNPNMPAAAGSSSAPDPIPHTDATQHSETTVEPTQKPSTHHNSLRKKGKRKRKAKAKLPKPPTVLVPFVEPIVPVVDIAQGRIEVNLPPGLIESTN